MEVRLRLEDAVLGIGDGHPCVQLASLIGLLLGHYHHFGHVDLLVEDARGLSKSAVWVHVV